MDVKEHSKTQPAFSEGFVHRILHCGLVLVTSGTKTQIGWLKSQTCISHSCGSWKSQVKGWQADVVPGEDSAALLMLPSHRALVAWRQRASSGPFLV